MAFRARYRAPDSLFAFDMKIPSRQLAFGCRGVQLLIVDAAGAEIATRIEQCVPSEAAVGGTGAPDLRYAVEPWQASWGSSGTGYRVLRDGKLRYLGNRVDRLVQWLRSDIDEQVSRRSRDGLLVQAAAVGWRERAILIPGRCRTGISSLATELVRHGATSYADSVAVLDDKGQVHPDTRTPPAQPLAVALIISTTYRPGLSWQPLVLRGVRAVLPVIDSALPERNEPRHILRIAARLASTVTTLQGPRSDASIAAPRILAALDELLDRRSPPTTVIAKTPALLSRARSALLTRRRRALEPDTPTAGRVW